MFKPLKTLKTLTPWEFHYSDLRFLWFFFAIFLLGIVWFLLGFLLLLNRFHYWGTPYFGDFNQKGTELRVNVGNDSHTL